jgi:protein KRI1
MNNLFSDDEGGSNPQLTINEHYAKAFEYKKDREELERRKCFYIYIYHPHSHNILLFL